MAQYGMKMRFIAKMKAKQFLHLNFGKCIAVAAISMAITLLAGLFTGVTIPEEDILQDRAALMELLLQFGKSQLLVVAAAVINSPILLGAFTFFHRMVRGENDRVSRVFFWCTSPARICKAFAVYLLYYLISLGYLLAGTAVPGALLALLYFVWTDLPAALAAFLNTICTGALLAGFVWAMRNAYAYIPFLFLMAERPHDKVLDALRFSRVLMRNRKTEFFVLELGFVLLQVLASFSCGFISLFVQPYIYLAEAVYTNEVKTSWIIDLRNRKLDEQEAAAQAGNAAQAGEADEADAASDNSSSDEQ